MRSFCNDLRKELSGSDTSVLEVSPGQVQTDFVEASVEDRGVPVGVFRYTVFREEVVAKAMADLGRNNARNLQPCLSVRLHSLPAPHHTGLEEVAQELKGWMSGRCAVQTWT